MVVKINENAHSEGRVKMSKHTKKRSFKEELWYWLEFKFVLDLYFGLGAKNLKQAKSIFWKQILITTGFLILGNLYILSGFHLQIGEFTLGYAFGHYQGMEWVKSISLPLTLGFYGLAIAFYEAMEQENCARNERDAE